MSADVLRGATRQRTPLGTGRYLTSRGLVPKTKTELDALREARIRKLRAQLQETMKRRKYEARKKAMN